MNVTFLGTGTSGGVPLIGCHCEVCKSVNPKDKRLRTSVLISSGNQKVVIDCGPDFRQQMLRENIENIHGVVFTHQHKDHTGGIDDIRAFNFINKKPIDFYCTRATEEGIKEQYRYAFTETDYPYLPRMNFIRIESERFSIGELHFLPISVNHGNMEVKGFRINEEFTYITDAKTISLEERNKIRGTKTLVINALRATDHYSHLTFDEALEIVNDIKPETAYFIHMSHQFGLHDEMSKILPSNVYIAYDGLQLSI